MIPQAAPRGQPRRISNDSVWPLRGPDGLTFAERKARKVEQERKDKNTCQP